jgi:hypothetical protein
MIWMKMINFCYLSVKKREGESPLSILVTKNPNRSHSLGKETDCVKEKY